MENTAFYDTETFTEESNNGITFSGLDPILGSLGEMIGLLDKEEIHDDTYNLINEWFTDPIEKTKNGFTEKSSNLGDLLGQILGKVGGNALGIPVKDPALLGTWYPVKYDDQETGLYFVTSQNGTETVLGLGVLHTWTVTSENPLVKVNVWGQIPFLRIDKGKVNITFDKEGYPINFGIAVEGANTNSPLIDINDVSFNGVKVNASIDLAAAIPFNITVQVLALKLVGDKKPSDRTLADLEAITGQQILETVSSLFVGALSKVFTDGTQQTRIGYLPPLMGLTSIVPDSDQKLPVLEWYELFKIASNPGQYPNGAATPFLNWFNTLSTNPAQLKTWLSCLGGIISGTPTAATGSGTRTNPFQISLISINDIGKLNFTVGTDVVLGGTRYFYPGISFSGKDIILGDSDVALSMEANLELAKFQLSGQNISADPTINFQFKCSLNNKKAGEPLCKFNEYSFGNLEGGMSFGLSGSVVPYFRLNKVVTGTSSFDTIDLLSPSQLANAGASLLSDGIKTLLGVTSTPANKFANNVASLIGLISPSGTSDWPASLAAPFDTQQMINSITNPIGAWAAYYQKVLKYAPLVNNKTAFTYIVQDFAQMLNAASGTETITVTGDGTLASPWKAGISLDEVSLPAYLTAYTTELPNKDTRLVLGLSLEPEISLQNIKVVPAITLDFVSVDFPSANATDSQITANWLPLIEAKLTLPDGFHTPEVAGVSVSVEKSQLSASWSRFNGWNWSLFVNKPALKLDGKDLALGQDLNFDDQSSLEDLVKNGVKTFGPFLVGALGTFLMRTNTRAGLFTTGAFGLLTDLSKSSIFPAKFKWDDFTQFKINSFSAPWTDIRNQIVDNFSTEDKSKSVLALLSWTINPDLETPPAIKGTGSFVDPYKMPLPKGFEIPLWYNTVSKVVGTGIGRNDVYKYTNKTNKLNFQFDLETRLNAIEYSLETGDFITANCPSFSLLGILSNPDGLLVDLPLNAGSVGKVILGLNLSIKDAAIKFEPVVTMLDVTLAGQEKRDSLTLNEILSPDFAASLQQAFYAILNNAVQVAIEQVKDVQGFKTTYELLSILGLVINRTTEDDPYAINIAGWNGLIANFDTYIQSQLSSLLTNVEVRKKLFAFLENIFDVKIPDFPKPLLDLLNGLGICGPASEGYPLYPKALLDIASNPVNSIRDRFENLFTDTALLQDLTRELVKDIQPSKWGNFTFSTNSSGVVTLSVLPENAFKLGSFAEFSGSLSLDLINRSMQCTLNAYCPVLQLALSNTINLRYPLVTDTIFTSKIIWGDGSKPAADALQLYPFKGDDFVSQLSKIAPAYVLNVLLNAVLEDSLLNKYPFLQQVFEGLGLAKKSDASQNKNLLQAASNTQDWNMESILGLLKDPLPWLLSDSVMGHNGRFNVGSLVHLLSNLPEVSTTNGIKVTPVTNGVKISGMPYDLGIDLTGDNGLASFQFGTKHIEIAGGTAVLDNLKLKVDLDANFQPAFSGGVDIATKAANIPFFISTGFDKEFLLKITRGNPENPEPLNLQLLPFLGWGNIAGQAAGLASVTLIKDLTPKLLEALSQTGAKPFIEKMTGFATAVDLNALIDALLLILTPQNFIDKTQAELLDLLENAGLTWLKGKFSKSNAPATAAAVKTLLDTVLPNRITTSKGLVLFSPGANMPIIKAGLNDKNLLGLWAGLEMPALEIVDIAIQDTGAGIDIDTGEFDFSFGLNLLVPIEGTSGPSINLEYISDKGFVLSLDPLTNKTQTGIVNSSLERQLLPEFFPGEGELSGRMSDWIFSLFKNVVPRYISALILNQDSVHAWLESPVISTGSGIPTPALLLEATSLINSEGSPSKKYYLNSFDNLSNITPHAFFGNLLKTLMQNEITLLTFGTDKKSKIIIGPEPNKPGSFGLHLFAPDLKIAALPNIVLQLGDKNADWVTGSGGEVSNPGIGIYMPIAVDAKTNELSADFSSINLVLDNVGFDIVGTDGKPLVNFSRFVINAIKPRVLFDLNLNGGDPKVTFGAGVTLEDIGVSLSPSAMASEGSKNPIASNLLGSGDEKSEGNPPTNPTFSVTAGYINKVYVNLKSNTGNGTEIILPIQRAFGPLFVDSLGLGWDSKSVEKYLHFLFSGSVELAGLKATLIGLDVGLPTTKPTDFGSYILDLQGLDISFKGGSVSLDAGLLKQTDPFLCYNGTAVIKGGSFSLMALGSYAEIPVSSEKGANTVPSLFVFGVLNTPLGGPPAFFITAVAAGFSYNRSIQIPSVENVQSFLLVKGVAEGSFTSNDPVKALTDLSKVVKPEIGQYWVAAGLKFKSFELITTVALLFLSFGKEWDINLLGLSYATLPPAVGDKDSGLALAYFELAIKVSFKPGEGIISAEARLTPNSFVLTKDCKVTGGFAFYLWYKDITTKDYKIAAGDFVITLGGYHPAFDKPVYYPDVPRLGMQWKMDIAVGKISITGGVYFALCPTAIMAGGYLNVSYELGPLSAWLNAYANFLIEWKPFYFNVGIGITVGVSFGITIAGVSVTLKAELGAKLNLEGPPTHGSVEINWYVISFTIPIGSGEARKDNQLTWGAFEQSFLPKTSPEQSAPKNLMLQKTADVPQEIVKWNADSGLQSTNADSAVWMVNPVPFSVSVQSAIPVSQLTVSNSRFEKSGMAVGVRPMGFINNLDAPFTISIVDSGGNEVDLSARGIAMTAITNGAPSALWSKEMLDKKQAPDPKTMLIEGALFGLTIHANRYVIAGNIPAFNIGNLKYDNNAVKLLPYALVPNYPAAPLYPDQNRSYTIIKQSIMNSNVIAKRNAVFEALRASGINAPDNPDLSIMAFAAEMILQDLPVIARLGIYQNGGKPVKGTPRTAVKGIKKAVIFKKEVRQPVLQGILKRYSTRAVLKSSKNIDSLNDMPLYSEIVRAKWSDKTADLFSQNEKEIASPDFITVHDGGIAMWETDVNSIATVNNQGSLPVLVFSFNKYGEITSMKYFESGSTYTLPAFTAQVVVQGYGQDVDNTAGWQKDTLLSKINPVWALTDRALIRTQNSQRILIPGTKKQIGLMDTGHLLKNNEVMGVKDLEPGWIQSLFPVSSKFIAVMTESIMEGDDDLLVTVASGEIPLKTGLSKPVKSFTENGKTTFVYAVPEAKSADSYCGVIAKPGNDNLNIIGMYGLSDIKEISGQIWENLSLKYGAIDLEANHNKSSTIQVTAK
ncbi:DUF6603 domain-containing protein [Flavobacterium sp. MC2016-06]|jgi:hypothetical protein|uniref:DUF6603 domain-containing protein n=1 Tax=Flavobacterium sp. MC2016-06 TaxID=2676308 RepID=UPI0012BAFDC3|nr:DUF6603 domain-containing protein [Flavobacterium sp. MC2016-06]MBU3857744.1 hypothetical protein [Flavobacterium sp. MC2016-06]